MDCYDYVSEKDIRKCRFYVRYMENRERSRIRVSTNFDWENNSGNVWETNTWINNELDSYFRRDVKYINDFVDEMEALCKDEILPLEEFNWFRHDKGFACGYGVRVLLIEGGVIMHSRTIAGDLKLLSNTLM
jgi:hypothetical protein